MSFTTKKYEVLVSFCHKLAVSVKMKANTFGF
jgi:hypothetical protein